jgi:hypothetical protein
MPVRLQPGDRELQLDWPGPWLVEPEPISWELDVVCGVERNGPAATATVSAGDTNWQHA